MNQFVALFFLVLSTTLITINANAATNMALMQKEDGSASTRSNTHATRDGPTSRAAGRGIEDDLQKFPQTCRLKSSGGPDCCKKKCVNVKADLSNCGMCSHKCKYSEMCCKGECVKTLFDRKHCGGCNNKCKKGQLCAYGMCNYV